MQQVWIQIAAVLALVVVNAILAGSEIALVSLREGQLKRLERGGRRQRTLVALARNPNRFLSTIQIGITLAGFLASATAAVTLAEPLVGPLNWLGNYARLVAIVLVTVVLSYVTLVLGELAPKRVALQRAEAWGSAFARPINAFAALTTPLLWLVERSTDAAVRVLGGNPSVHREEMTEAEVRDLVLTRPGFTRLQREILSGAFEIEDRRLKEVAVPRPEVDFVPADAAVSDAVRILLENRHSRAPVRGVDVDDVVGTIHLRDLIQAEGTAQEHVREAKMLPETLPVMNALRELQRTHQQMAVVIDEHGGVEGIVTIEDLLEELVGEIYDEFDRDVSRVRREPGGTIDLPGGFPVHDLPDLDIRIPGGDYTTIAGVVLDALGRLPDEGESVEVADWRIEVVAVGDRSIERVRVSPVHARR